MDQFSPLQGAAVALSVESITLKVEYRSLPQAVGNVNLLMGSEGDYQEKRQGY
ncbi:MAG: hypothetical protein Q3M30_03895 [Candidatus Electrothrix sp. Rat3]|nr:hypothetical protein [Candidatus Electrothrix rattekaaiensis]